MSASSHASAMARLQDDFRILMNMANHVATGIQSLNQENVDLNFRNNALQLALRQKETELVIKDKEMREMNSHRIASTDVEGRLKDAQNVHSQLKAAVQTLKKLNVEVLQAATSTKGQLVSLQGELDHLEGAIVHLNAQHMGHRAKLPIQAGGNDVKELRTDVKGQPSAPDIVSAVPTQSQVSSGIGRPHPTPRPHAIPIKSPMPQGDSEIGNIPIFQEAKAKSAGPIKASNDSLNDVLQTESNQASDTRPNPNGIMRGGKQVDEAFARFQRNLLAKSNNGNSNGSSRDFTPYTGVLRSEALEEEAARTSSTATGVGKASLNPECVPTGPPALKSTSFSKLNPFSEPFKPATVKTEPSVIASPERALVAATNQAPSLLTTSSSVPKTETQKLSTSKNSAIINAKTSLDASPDAKISQATVNAGSRSPIPPHLRRPRARASGGSSHEIASGRAVQIPEASTMKENKKPADALHHTQPDTFSDKTNSMNASSGKQYDKSKPKTQAENISMETWLDILERKTANPSAPPASTTITPARDTLIDFDHDYDELEMKKTAAEVKVDAGLQIKIEDEEEVPAFSNRTGNEATLSTSPSQTMKDAEASSLEEDEYTKLIRGNSTTADPPNATGTVPESKNGSRFEKLDGFEPKTKQEEHLMEAFLAAYGYHMDTVQEKYEKKAEGASETADTWWLDPASPAGTRIQPDNSADNDQDYKPPAIKGTRALGELLDRETKSHVIKDSQGGSSTYERSIGEWKPVIKDGRKVYVL